jgi:hypothetical protein
MTRIRWDVRGDPKTDSDRLVHQHRDLHVLEAPCMIKAAIAILILVAGGGGTGVGLAWLNDPDSDDVDLRAIDPIVVSLMLSLILRAPLRRVSPTADTLGTQSAARTATYVDSRQRARSMNRKG